MSVEDIQKVNNLAKELLDQGFCESRDDAVQKAQEMLNKEIAQGQVGEENQSSSKQEVDEAQLRNMVERTKSYVESQLSGYKVALLGLEKELRNLHQQVQELKTKASQQAAQAAPAPIQETSETEKNEEKPKESKNNPRTGNISSEDVSIEKMFYYGNK